MLHLLLFIFELWLVLKRPWKDKSSFADFLVKIGLGLGFERLCPKQDGIEDDSQSPSVNHRTKVFLLVAKFRCHVGWCSTESLKLLVRAICLSCESKVDDFSLETLMFHIHQYVL